MVNFSGTILVAVSETQSRHCEELVIVNSPTFTSDVQCVSIRADRPSAVDQDSSFSSIRRKLLPEPFVSTDDGDHYHGSSLCVPKGPGHRATSQSDITQSKRIEVANLAGVPSETDVACHKLPIHQIHDTTTVNKSGT